MTTAPEKNAVDRLFDRVFAFFPIRVMLLFGGKNGFVLAAGLAYQALFALFAALWSGFAVAGIVLSQSPSLQDSLFDIIDASVPGLISSPGGGGKGAIDPTSLLHASVFSLTGAIAVVVLVFTAIGFLGSARGSVRTIFDVPQPTEPFLLLKAKDLLIGLLFGVAVLASSVLSLVSTSSVRFLLGMLDISQSNPAATLLLRLVGLAVVFVFDTAVLMGLFIVLAGLHIPRRRLLQGALLGALALGVLKTVAGSLLGRGTTNPLLASFAVIVGLLIFLNLVCQVLLIVASWIALMMARDGVLADPVAEKARVERLQEELRLEREREAAARRREIELRALRAKPLWIRAASAVRDRFRRGAP
ncbi:membrane protein [Frondihabitans sp. PhB188]|uniref:YihY/virulence factor BrkB family protein n=1 Tax=Frondihabitans sp. PhB188 TaxID=2485200 RepID=UPI000F46F215|nr:YhjD/YihY/BrkB family envelope integrity protein [Frondihabitans sp. PhB188]ROQ41495.1 membrane protein [Frondihabitans sp. PhB188]